MLYIGVAGFLTAIFIATVYYLLVLFQFPQVPLSSGYWLGILVIVFGAIKHIVAKTNGQKSDSKVLIFAGLLLFIATYILIFLDVHV